jgi:hypothetical protein
MEIFEKWSNIKEEEIPNFHKNNQKNANQKNSLRSSRVTYENLMDATNEGMKKKNTANLV